jgi:hypothetical protein
MPDRSRHDAHAIHVDFYFQFTATLRRPHGWHVALGVVGVGELGILRVLLPASGCSFSQIAIVKLAAVPLWKVIVGPRADEL